MTESRPDVAAATPSPRSRRRRLRRVLATALTALAAAWLLVQVALNTPLVPSLASRHPERISVHWRLLLMPWPGHLAVRGLEVRSNTRNMQWWTRLERATVSLRLGGLFDRRFETESVRGSGLSFHLRRKPKTGAEPSAPISGLAPIPGLELEPAVPPPSGAPRPPGWRFALAGIDIDRLSEIWVDSLRLRGAGSVLGAPAVQIRGDLALPELALEIEQGSLEQDRQEVARDLRLQVVAQLEPTLPGALRGLGALRPLSGSLDASGNVDGLGFLQPLLERTPVSLQARGTLSSHLVLAAGVLQTGSSLQVEAPTLRASLPRLEATGRGLVTGRVDEQGIELTTRLEQLELSGDGGDRLGGADRLTLLLRTTGADPAALLAAARDPAASPPVSAMLELPSFHLPDLAAFDSLLPQGLGLQLLAGQADVRSLVRLDAEASSGELQVHADDAVVRFRDRRLRGDLEVSAVWSGAADPTTRRAAHLTVDGTRVELRGVQEVRGAGTGGSAGDRQRVGLTLQVREGAIELGAPGRDGTRPSPPRLADGKLVLAGRLDNLGWWNLGLPHARWLRLDGSAALDADLSIRRGALAPGSSLHFQADPLEAAIESWVSKGAGTIDARLDARGTELTVALDGFRVRSGERAEIVGPRMSVRARGPNLAALAGGNHGLADLEVHLDLGGDLDLASFGDYFVNRAFQLRRGKARLDGNADLASAKGAATLKLVAEDLELGIIGSPIDSALELTLRSTSDDPASRWFEIVEGRVQLRDVSWPGAAAGTPWQAELRLVGGRIWLGKPLRLDAPVQLTLTDTRPLVFLVGEGRRMIRWFHRLLEVRDVTGSARLLLDEGGLRLRDLTIDGKGLMVRGQLDVQSPPRALLLMGLHGLRAGVELENGKRDVQVLRPTPWYESRVGAWHLAPPD